MPCFGNSRCLGAVLQDRPEKADTSKFCVMQAGASQRIAANALIKRQKHFCAAFLPPRFNSATHRRNVMIYWRFRSKTPLARGVRNV